MAYIDIKDMDYQLKRKGQADRSLFANLNLALDREAMSLLVGDNGVGKTTLTKMILGFTEPDHGSVTVDGKQSKDYTRAEIGRKIGYLFQNPSLQLFNSTVREELLFAYEVQGQVTGEIEARCHRIIQALSLEDTLETPVFHLSQGEKQRLAIGTLLMNDPDYLILDEPTSGLDGSRKDMVCQILTDLQAQGIGMLIISHDQELIQRLPAKTYTMSEGTVSYDL